MKRIISVLLVLGLLFSFAGCGAPPNNSDVDVNLVVDDVLSPIAVYTMATQACQAPDKYDGKTVQAEGALLNSEESATGVFVEIADNTGCCYQNIAFRMKDKSELPAENTIILVKGTFKVETDPAGAKVLVIEADSLENRDYLYE